MATHIYAKSIQDLSMVLFSLRFNISEDNSDIYFPVILLLTPLPWWGAVLRANPRRSHMYPLSANSEYIYQFADSTNTVPMTNGEYGI